MKNDTTITMDTRMEELLDARKALDLIARLGAQEMLQKALEVERAAFLERHADLRLEDGHQRIVGNGFHEPRTVLTGAGPLELKKPRVRDKGAKGEDAIKFSSWILPRYLRRSKTIDELVPWLYLKGISTGDFPEALQALLGPDAKGLSANVIVKLKDAWNEEFKAWQKRDLSQKEYVYVWADGIYCNVRLDDERQCILVLMGATKDGTKELIAVRDGYRESEQSWKEILLDLKAQGLKTAPKLATGDGALGFWAALRKVWPTTREQRCWFHKTGNVLNALPKSMQSKAKADLHEIWMAETRKDASKAFDVFLEKYEAKYPKAAKCLAKDRDVLLAFYDFPGAHWIHLRTTNPIESTFATVRLRHRRTKGSGTRQASLVMVFKLAQVAQKGWRRLNTPNLVLEVARGRTFVDGEMRDAA
jgi:transposase-like protein